MYLVLGVTNSPLSSSLFLSLTPLEDKSSTENKESWHLAELKPTTSADANNIYSFQLKFAGTAATDFEINDISIVYRSKQVK